MFTIDNKVGFMYKGLLKGKLFITLMILINAFLFISAFLFKMFEDYSGKNNPFSNLYNCLWYLIVTMNTSNKKMNFSWIWWIRTNNIYRKINMCVCLHIGYLNSIFPY